MSGIETKLSGAYERLDDLRVRTHLWRAEQELRFRGDDGRRSTFLDYLAEYRRAGDFPTNDGHSSFTPYFVGADGNRCAMGELAHIDGREDVVDEVSENRNNVDLSEEEPPDCLAEWVENSPFSPEEAALVQPTYGENGLCFHCSGISTLQMLGMAIVLPAYAIVKSLIIGTVYHIASETVNRGSPMERIVASRALSIVLMLSLYYSVLSIYF